MKMEACGHVFNARRPIYCRKDFIVDIRKPRAEQQKVEARLELEVGVLYVLYRPYSSVDRNARG